MTYNIQTDDIGEIMFNALKWYKNLFSVTNLLDVIGEKTVKKVTILF